jgi:hypothetical protein
MSSKPISAAVVTHLWCSAACAAACRRSRTRSLTRNDIRYGNKATDPVIPTLAIPTPTQRQAFDLLGTTIPVTLA